MVNHFVNLLGVYPPIDIVQIGAVTDNERRFNLYVKPTKHMEDDASNRTGLCTDSSFNLYKRDSGKYISNMAQSQESGLRQFLEWLKLNVGYRCTLIAYNGENYDFRVLREVARDYGVPINIVIDYYDPMHVRF